MSESNLNLKYHFDKYVYRAKRQYTSNLGGIFMAAAMGAVPFATYAFVYDNVEPREVRIDDQKSALSDTTYSMFARSIEYARSNFDTLQERITSDENVSASGDVIARMREGYEMYQNELIEIYTELYTNQHLTESQFADLRTLLIEKDMSFYEFNINSKDYSVNITDANPYALRECQNKRSINYYNRLDPHAPQKYTRYLNNCMTHHYNEHSHKQDRAVRMSLLSVMAGLIGFAVLWGVPRDRRYRLQPPCISQNKYKKNRYNH